MKKYLFGIALFSLIAVSCQKENALKQVDDVCTMMDDINFMKFCYDSFDVNNDGRVSMEEANAVSKIRVYDKHLKSLKGIEYFSRLTVLDCEYNQLTSLDVTKNTQLTELYCEDNQLTSLDVTKNTQLTGLNCSGNQLTSLDVTKNTQLTWLRCEYNQLTSLDVTKNTQLTALFCYNNQLTALDVTKNTQLTTLYCNPQSAGDITPTGWPK